MSTTGAGDVLWQLSPITTSTPSEDVVSAIKSVGPTEVAQAMMERLSPSGILPSAVNTADAIAQLHTLMGQFDQVEKSVAYLYQESVTNRLIDDFASVVPALADASTPLENWAIPILCALVGPLAPLLSFGLTLACKLALAALQAWAKRRLASKPVA